MTKHTGITSLLIDTYRRLAYQYRSLEAKARLEGDEWTAKGHADTARLFEAELDRLEASKPAPQSDPFEGFREVEK
jgi:hypothetical protein